jgi:hypothetical protein
MASNYYLGQSPQEALGDSPRYWYALRRNDDGELFFYRSDQLTDKDSIELNRPGKIEDNFEDFEPGIDFFEGIAEDHETEYANLVWVQYRWDNRNILYYIGPEEGRLIQRINQGYVYPEGTSSNG